MVAEEAPKKKMKAKKNEGGGKNVDPASVFVKGIPEGTTDDALRRFFEEKVGKTKECFLIRDDYGLVTFRAPEFAAKCLRDLKDAEFKGAKLKLQAGKIKRGQKAAPARKEAAPDASADATPSAGSKGKAKAGRPAGFTVNDIRSVQLSGLPHDLSKEDLQSWVETKLQGGCGLESVQRKVGKENLGSFVVHFRKDTNAKRAVEALHGAELQGRTVTASFRALEAAKTAGKAGRLIVRNMSFSANEKLVRKAFGALGELSEVNFPTKEVNGQQLSKGFCFLQYKDPSLAQRAVDELNGVRIAGRGVAVDFAVQATAYKSLQQQEEKAPREQAKKADAPKTLEPQGDEEEGDEGEASEKKGKQKRQNAEETAEASRVKALLEEVERGEKPKEAEKKEEKKENKEKRQVGFDVEEQRSIFVRNVPFDATAEDLKEVFRKFGKVWGVKLVADKEGKNAHKGAAFVKFAETAGAEAVLKAEEEAEKKLKDMTAVARKVDRFKELPAVEGFGISCKGRRLVVKSALKPEQATQAQEEKKPKKGQALEEKAKWRFLLTVGDISKGSTKWEKLSLSEQKLREASEKERRFRINNPNFVLHPKRLSIRNLPRTVDCLKLRQAIVKHLAGMDNLVPGAKTKQERRKAAEKLITKADLVRSTERKDETGVRRSRGFAFVELKEHEAAFQVLDYINDNPKVFGGNRRPIVQFAIEDKRKLKMQQEMFEKHGHKLLNGQDPKKWQPSLDVRGGVAKPREDGEEGGKGEGKGEAKKFKKKKKKEGVVSRGRRQREKRRREKLEAVEKQKARVKSREEKILRIARRKHEETLMRGTRAKDKSKMSDATTTADEVKKRKVGDITNDFELQAMEKFRQ